MRDRSLHRGPACAVLACAMVVLPGCRVVKRWFAPAEQVELAGRTRGQLLAEPELAPEGARRGLEVRLAVVDDTLYDAPRLLSELSANDGSPIDPELARRWADWGFRLVSIPRSQVEPFLDALTPVQAGSVQWLGEFGAWRALVRAGELGTTVVRVGEGIVRIDPGRPRLIARSWVEPELLGPGVGAAVRLDLGMQIERTGRRAAPLLSAQRERSLEDEGTVIDELLLSLTLSGDRALVLLGEEPGVDWARLPEPMLTDATTPADNGDGEQDPGADRDTSSVAFGPTPDEERERLRAERVGGDASAGTGRGAEPVEPARPRMRTLGELMLTTPGSRIVRLNEARAIPKRVVVVLIPSADGAFRLLPGTTPAARVQGGG